MKIRKNYFLVMSLMIVSLAQCGASPVMNATQSGNATVIVSQMQNGSQISDAALMNAEHGIAFLPKPAMVGDFIKRSQSLEMIQQGMIVGAPVVTTAYILLMRYALGVERFDALTRKELCAFFSTVLMGFGLMVPPVALVYLNRNKIQPFFEKLVE